LRYIDLFFDGQTENGDVKPGSLLDNTPPLSNIPDLIMKKIYGATSSHVIGTSLILSGIEKSRRGL